MTSTNQHISGGGALCNDGGAIQFTAANKCIQCKIIHYTHYEAILYMYAKLIQIIYNIIQMRVKIRAKQKVTLHFIFKFNDNLCNVP